MSIWDDFHARHKRQNFTPAFNAHLEAKIEDSMLPIEPRIDAWLLRGAWGNHLDAVVDADGVRQTQADCARTLGVDRRRVNGYFQLLAARNYVQYEGYSILLVDDPRGVFANSSPTSTPFSSNDEEQAKQPLDMEGFIEQVWGPQNPAAYQAYQQVGSLWKEMRTEILDSWKSYKRDLSERVGQQNECPKGSATVSERVGNCVREGRTNGSASLYENGKLKTVDKESRADDATQAEASGWDRFRELVGEAGLRMSPAEEPRRQRQFEELPFEQRIAACRGIQQRLDSGEYPSYAPSVKNYLYDEKWALPVRKQQPGRTKKKPDYSKLEQWATEAGA